MDPNPGMYGAPFEYFGESGHVSGPDRGWCGSGNRGDREGVSKGVYSVKIKKLRTGFSQILAGKFPEFFL